MFTSFSKIQVYQNITDDQAGGNSLFISSVKRAFELYNTVRLLPDNQFSLTVFDEIFNGTDPYIAKKIALTLFERLGEQKRNIGFLTTHFKPLLTLEKKHPGSFSNYKVTAKLVDNKLHYPFKLEKGISDNNVAFDVLREKGSDEEFVKACQDQDVD